LFGFRKQNIAAAIDSFTGEEHPSGPARFHLDRLRQRRLPGRRALFSMLALLATLGIFIGNANAGQVALAWDAVSGATGYRLYYGTSSGNYASNVDAKTATSYTVANLSDGARYYFSVRSYNATTTSGYSTEVNTVVGAAATGPVASFTASSTSGTAPLTVNFTDTSTGGATAWSWNFGNGSSSTAKNPSATYTTAGTFTVTLTATASGKSNSTSKTITVSAPTGGGGTGGSTAVKSGLVAAYGFEESSGSQVIDASGFGNHGTISNATRVTTTHFGRVLSFSGTNSSWVTVTDKASLDLSSGVTLEAWVYPTASMSGWDTVMTKEQTGGLAYALSANSSANRPNTTVNVGGTDRQLTAGSYLPANAWTHLAATYNGSTQRLYVNGALVGSRAQTGAITLSSGALRIGGNSVWGSYFKGYIDEVRVYNRELSQAEISDDSKAAVVGLVSTSSSRSNPVPLNGLPISGSVYVSYNLISPTASSNPATEVTFWLDDPNPNSPTGTPRRIDTASPFDLAGNNSDGTARAISGLTKGVHTVTARVKRKDGTVLPYIKGTFTVQ
jgi:PKD repeat protein